MIQKFIKTILQFLDFFIVFIVFPCCMIIYTILVNENMEYLRVEKKMFYLESSPVYYDGFYIMDTKDAEKLLKTAKNDQIQLEIDKNDSLHVKSDYNIDAVSIGYHCTGKEQFIHSDNMSEVKEHLEDNKRKVDATIFINADHPVNSLTVFPFVKYPNGPYYLKTKGMESFDITEIYDIPKSIIEKGGSENWGRKFPYYLSFIHEGHIEKHIKTEINLFVKERVADSAMDIYRINNKNKIRKIKTYKNLKKEHYIESLVRDDTIIEYGLITDIHGKKYNKTFYDANIFSGYLYVADKDKDTLFLRELEFSH